MRKIVFGAGALSALAAAVSFATIASAGVSPASGTLTVPAGSSASTTFTIDVPAGPATTPLTDAEIEIAIDTTGSMASGIAQARADAAALVSGVQAQIPGARFAIVQFRDRLDVPEYSLEQPLTTDSALISAALGRMTAGGGGDAPEAHNLVFTNASVPSVGGPIGWTASAPKFVIVLSDAQPHGAGSAGINGCTDVSADPFGLNTRTALSDLSAGSRTLFMVLEPGALSASLNCYQFLALGVSPVSRGFTGGASLASQLVPLITGTTTSATDIRVAVASASPSPASSSWISTTPSSFGPLPLPASVTPRVNVSVPSSAPTGIYTFDLVALADGLDVGHYTLTVDVSGTAAPAATVSATPAGDAQKRKGGGGGGGGGTTTSAPDLQVSGSASKGSPAPGSVFTYSFQVRNTGSATATNVTLNDALPIELAVLNVVSTQGTCGHAGDQVSCNIGSIPAGSRVDVTITAQAPDFTGSFVNSANVLLSETDLKPDNNSTSLTITVK